MTAEHIVDILLENEPPPDEAEAFYNSHLLASPAHLFTGKDSWASPKSYVHGDGSYGTKIYPVGFRHNDVDFIIFTLANGEWVFRSHLNWHKAHMQEKWLEFGQDIVARTDEHKLMVIRAVIDWMSEVNEFMRQPGVSAQRGDALFRELKPTYARIFQPLYALGLGQR